MSASTPPLQPASSLGRHQRPAARVQGFGATVFAEFSALALQTGAINLGQGFPNFPAPDFIKKAATDAIQADLNQYARGAGHLPLVQQISDVYSPLFGRALDPLSEVVITTGATEGIFAAMQAFLDPGDEVVLLEPFYDSYPAAVTMAGGVPVLVPMRFPDGATSAGQWTLDVAELRAAITPLTRMVVLNTPSNPVGKVFTREELESVAAIAIEHELIVLSDEVYEWMVYDEVRHVRIATLPGMAERTITLGSAGKSFSVTGWKIGWAIAPPALSHALLMAHQWIPYAVATPLQDAVAKAFAVSGNEGYFEWMAQMYAAKRARLMEALDDAGLVPQRPDGSYFILVDTSHLPVDIPATMRRDVAVCRWLTTEVGVAAIPPSAFYSQDHQRLAENLARFCFCKTDEMLDEAALRLRRMRSQR